MSTRSMIHVVETAPDYGKYRELRDRGEAPAEMPTVRRVLFSCYKHWDGYPDDLGNGWLLHAACEAASRAAESDGGRMSASRHLVPLLVKTFVDADAGVEVEPAVRLDDWKGTHSDVEYAYVLDPNGASADVTVLHAEEDGLRTEFSGDWKELAGRYPIWRIPPAEWVVLDAAVKAGTVPAEAWPDILRREPRLLEDVPDDVRAREHVMIAAEAFGREFGGMEWTCGLRRQYDWLCDVAEDTPGTSADEADAAFSAAMRKIVAPADDRR